MPIISVVIPTYQRAAYVAEAIESALAQEVDLEVIVVDDGSTDATPDVLRGFGKQITCLWQANKREGAARNLGLRHAQADLIAFLDSDDVLLPGKLRRDVEALRRYPDAGLVFSRAVFIDSDGRELRRAPLRPPDRIDAAALLRENLIPLSTVMVRASLVRALGGFSEAPEISGSYDWHLWMRIAARHHIHFVPADGARMRSHPGNMMTVPERMEGSIRAAARSYFRDEAVQRAIGMSTTRAWAWVELQVALVWAFAGEPTHTLRSLAAAARRDPAVLRDPRAAKIAVRSLLGARAWTRLAKVRRHLRGE